MDGRRNLFADSRYTCVAWTSLQGGRTWAPHQDDRVITTLVDAEQYTQEDIRELYGFRWSSELDIRSIISNLNLGHVRCKSPQMVGREVWTTLLEYNLIRTTMAGAICHAERVHSSSAC